MESAFMHIAGGIVIICIRGYIW